jgi:hypothetical protein
MNNLKNLRVFEVSFISPTNYKGSRVLINDLRHKKRVIIPFNYSFNSALDVGLNFLTEKGIKIKFSAEIKKGFILLSEDFKTQIKQDLKKNGL